MSMTYEQSEVFEHFEQDCVNLVNNFVREAKRAHEAIVSLPHANPSGSSVIHRDNLYMIRAREMYLAGAQTFASYLNEAERQFINEKYGTTAGFSRFK